MPSFLQGHLSIARLIRIKTAIETQPFRNEGKAVVLKMQARELLRDQQQKLQTLCRELSTKSTIRAMPSFLQGHLSVDTVRCLLPIV